MASLYRLAILLKNSNFKQPFKIIVMKKSILILLLAMFTFSAVNAQNYLAITAYQKAGITNADSLQNINTENIYTMYTLAGKNHLHFIDFNLRTTYDFTIRENLDTIAALVNTKELYLIKLNKAQRVSQVDSFLPYWYSSKYINRFITGTVPYFSYGTSKLYYANYAGTTVYPVKESRSRILAIMDSTRISNTDLSPTTSDTSNYTQKTTDKHIFLNSATADTLTLLNPNLFIKRGEVFITNIGSGAYTIAGGFTVKDKSGTNVTSIAANSFYIFKSYYNGSGYEWRKEN